MSTMNAQNVNTPESSTRNRRKLKAERVQGAGRRGPRRLKAERVQGPVGGRQQLKAERVQLAAGNATNKLKAERVQVLLSGLPGWGLTTAGGAIVKEWHFPQPRVAAAYAAHVAGLAAAEGKTVHLVLSGSVLSLVLATRLPGGSREGLTENDFRFAARLG
jgi:pterin-4a-carbinolamine dehydratase